MHRCISYCKCLVLASAHGFTRDWVGMQLFIMMGHLSKVLLVCCQALCGELLQHMVEHQVDSAATQGAAALHVPGEVLKQAGPHLGVVLPRNLGKADSNLHCKLHATQQRSFNVTEAYTA